LRMVGGKFDLIFIDGDHRYAGAKRDWENIQRFRGENTVIVFDDLHHCDGCGDVFFELCDTEDTEQIGNLGVVYSGARDGVR